MAVKAKSDTLNKVGDYDLLEKIGEGAAGAVYKGRHRATGQVVAVKIVNEEVAADPILVKRFEREFTTSQRLNHPHIVRSFDCDLNANPPYLVMEFIEGDSLADIIGRRGAFPEAEAIVLITQVADALQEAHEHGIYHRDVKPDNILISRDGQAKLTDLGIAKDLHTDGDLTTMGRGPGTPHFMAPEQLNNAKDVDARCDIYGLGATLYMMVTGIMPFFSKGPVITIFKKKAWNQYTPPRDLAPALSERLAAVIEQAMQAEVAARHSSCLEFITHLTGKSTAHSRPAKERQIAALVAEGPLSRPAGAERRAGVRYPSKARGACHAVGGEKHPHWKAAALNISASGICLLINRRFNRGSVLVIELEGKAASRPRRLLVRVVRVELHSPRKWLIGCSLLRKLSEEAVQELREQV